jgi:RNA polymerase sigma factor (sigma-70 family)
MATRQGAAVLRVIRQIAQRDRQASDRDLLVRFVERGDQDEFSALVRRHGAMVLGVGLRVLRHYQDAEDVCQATFLLLARKARAKAWRESVASWLYQTAYHLAQTARRAARRRKAQEARLEPKTPPDALAEITVRDLQAVLDEELNRLAPRYRAPLLLCCLEGKTRDEAARFLDVPLSTLMSRLQQGRELLRRRLAGRGVPLALALAGVSLASETCRATVPATLVRALSETALPVATGKALPTVLSANVLTLVKGGMRTIGTRKVQNAHGDPPGRRDPRGRPAAGWPGRAGARFAGTATG